MHCDDFTNFCRSWWLLRCKRSSRLTVIAEAVLVEKKPGTEPAELRIRTGNSDLKHLYGMMSGFKGREFAHPHTLVITKVPTAMAGEKQTIARHFHRIPLKFSALFSIVLS